MTNKTRTVALTVSAVSTLWAANPAFAQESETILELKSQVQELDQKLRVVERRLELEREASSEKSKSTPVISAGAAGFSFRSADTNFVLKLRGYVQADSRWFIDDGIDANDTFLLRRVRPIFEGTVFDKYDFRVMLDFGSGTSSSAANNGFLQDAYLNARFLPEFQLQFGKFKEPVGLERLQSGANLLFVERAYPTQLLPNRDAGVQLHGELFSGTLNYAVGIFNGVANGGSGDFETADDEKDGAARLFAQPFRNTDNAALKGLGIGLAGTYGNQEGALRSFVSPGQQRFFAYRTSTAATAPNVEADGDHIRLTPQGYYFWGPLGIFGEYAISSQDVRQVGGGAGAGEVAELRHTAWQVAASYVLTGEENSWRGITPKRPFNLSGGGWGAWEIAARYSELDIDDDTFPVFSNPDTSATRARSWTIGVNWHLNRNVKFNLNYEQTDFEGGDQNPITAQKEHAILTRAQVSF
jgi:phosphate-selective porin OprO and OprP